MDAQTYESILTGIIDDAGLNDRFDFADFYVGIGH